MKIKDMQSGEEIISEIGNRAFFISEQGPFIITANDNFAKNCKIELMKFNRFSDAFSLLKIYAEQLGIDTKPLLDFSEKISERKPKWFIDIIGSVFVPYDFFRINKGGISISDIIDISFLTTRRENNV